MLGKSKILNKRLAIPKGVRTLFLYVANLLLLVVPDAGLAAAVTRWVPASEMWADATNSWPAATKEEWMDDAEYRARGNAPPSTACQAGMASTAVNVGVPKLGERLLSTDGWTYSAIYIRRDVSYSCSEDGTVNPNSILETQHRIPGYAITLRSTYCPVGTIEYQYGGPRGDPIRCRIQFQESPTPAPCTESQCANGGISCCRGNPIDISTGDKRQTEIDVGGALPYVRTYSSYRQRWESNYDAYMMVAADIERNSCVSTGVVRWDFRFTGAQPKTVCLSSYYKPERISFVISPHWLIEFDRATLNPIRPDLPFSLRVVGNESVLQDLKNGRIYVFDNEFGTLTRLVDVDGKSKQLTYIGPTGSSWPASSPTCVRPSSGTIVARRPLCITDSFGRQLDVRYDGYGMRVERIFDASGAEIKFIYYTYTPEQILAGENLSFHVILGSEYQDGSTKRYLYEQPILNSRAVWENDPSRNLTGIIDENGARFATFQYDSSGRAVQTEHGVGIDSYSYAGNTLTTPTGATRTIQFSEIAGLTRASSETLASGSGSPASTREVQYDANGNIASSTDFNGNRTCRSIDLARNVETSRIEGLAAAGVCSTVLPAASTLPANSRRISTQWHPDLRFATKKSEPGRITTYVYNGQPDPFNANAVASCAPAGTLLPNGKPIVVLCRQVEQATTDANGAMGLAAPLQAGEVARENKWTYNALGQMLTHDGPRTDVADVTTYAYYTDSTPDHTRGDLATVTNPLGQVTTYRKYNKHGQALEWVEANGVVTVQTFDLRQRLRSVSVGGQTTGYDLDAVGQVKRINQPDGSWVGFDYDDAHRMTAAYDSLGNRIDYTLDNAGNRRVDAVKDPTGTLRRTVNRDFDALGRPQQLTGRE